MIIEPKDEGGEFKRRKDLRLRHLVHDQGQLESILTFDLRSRFRGEGDRRFRTDIYFYLPLSLGINPSTFSSQQYFQRRTSYYRIRAPRYPNWKTLPPENWSLPYADAYLAKHLSMRHRERLAAQVIEEVKLFGNFVYTELKKLRVKLSKRGRKKDGGQGFDVDTLFHYVDLLWAFRKRYLQPIRNGCFLLDEEVLRAFHLTDEYLSYRVELVLLRARDVLAQDEHRLGECLERELRYRKEHELLVLEGNRTSIFEAYTYRLGLLKKYLGEALFLQTKVARKDVLYKNYAAAIGAGLAALFTGIVEHQRIQYLEGGGSGIRFSFLILVAVIAYIFKDRIKELSRDYFNLRMRERLPDESFRLFYTGVTRDETRAPDELGTVAEYCRFVKDIPPDIAYLRDLGRVGYRDPKRHEVVMHVARRFDLKVANPESSDLLGLLKNVVRLDISPFLSKLDDPTTSVSYFGRQKTLETVAAPKVYHVNLICRYECFSDDPKAGRRIDYEHLRLVINKNGILRLETEIESGRLAYWDTKA